MIRIKNEEAAEKIKDFHFPAYNEIPNVGLFLEQATKFVSEYLEPLEGITITSSMISNYVKKKLIDNPIKKQYYRDQIVYMIFIAVAKSVLTLEEIEILINVRQRNYDTPAMYEYFCKEFETILFYVFGVNDSLENIEPTPPNEDRQLLQNTIITATSKIYLDTIFALRANEDKES